MAELVLHLPDIDEAGKDYAFELAPAWLEDLLRDAGLRPDPAFGAGALTVHAQQNGTEYLVTGQLRAHLLTECGRCLGDAQVPVDVAIAALYARGHATSPGAKAQPKAAEPERRHPPHEARGHAQRVHELSDEDDLDDELQRELFAGNEIVLDGLVREHMVLEVPMQPLCSEECQGIAVPKHLRPPPDVFREQGAVDPRLAPLQRLRDNVPQNAAPSAHDAKQAAKPVTGAKPTPNKQPTNKPNKANRDTDKE